MNIRIVAVARPVGTAGEEIAQLTAEKLGFRFYDYQVVQTAAQEAGVSPETVSEAEHTPSLLTPPPPQDKGKSFDIRSIHFRQF